MRYAILTLMILYNGAALAQPTQVEVAEESTCADNAGGHFNMSELSISLSNIRLVGNRYYTLSGNSVVIGDYPLQRIDITIYDVRFLVNADDLKIFHARLLGRPYIYWIEETDDELSRNGLLGINGEQLMLVCEGTIRR